MVVRVNTELRGVVVLFLFFARSENRCSAERHAKSISTCAAGGNDFVGCEAKRRRNQEKTRGLHFDDLLATK